MNTELSSNDPIHTLLNDAATAVEFSPKPAYLYAGLGKSRSRIKGVSVAAAATVTLALTFGAVAAYNSGNDSNGLSPAEGFFPENSDVSIVKETTSSLPETTVVITQDTVVKPSVEVSIPEDLWKDLTSTSEPEEAEEKEQTSSSDVPETTIKKGTEETVPKTTAPKSTITVPKSTTTPSTAPTTTVKPTSTSNEVNWEWDAEQVILSREPTAASAKYYGTAAPYAKVWISSAYGGGWVYADADGEWFIVVYFEELPEDFKFKVTAASASETEHFWFE